MAAASLLLSGYRGIGGTKECAGNAREEKNSPELTTDTAALIGEACPGAENLFLAAGFSEGIPEGAVCTNISVTDREAVVSYALDEWLYAAVYDYETQRFRYSDSLSPIAILSYYDENTGETTELGFENRRILPCGESYYAYSFCEEIQFYDRDFEALSFFYAHTEEPSFLQGFAADVWNSTLSFYYPDGRSEDVKLPEMRSGYVMGQTKEGVLVYCVDEYRNHRCLAVDPETFEIRESGILPPGASISGDLMYRKDRHGNCLFSDYLESSLCLQYPLSREEYPVMAYRDGYLTGWYDYDFSSEETVCSLVLRYYGKEALNPLWSASLTSSSNLWIYEIGCFGDLLVFSPNPNDERPELVVAKVRPENVPVGRPKMQKTGEGKDAGVVALGDPDFYERKNYESAQEVWGAYNEYGIGVSSDARVEETEFPDYRITAGADPAAVRKVKAKIRAFLKMLPKGFLDDVIRGYDGFEYYLVDDIEPKSGAGIETVAAFAIEQDNRYYIVIDVNMFGIESTLPHEFLHMAENSMNRMTENGGVFDFWNTLNPEDFSYHYSFHDENGAEYTTWEDPEYTPSDERAWQDPEFIWFTDAYAKTYPTEDRARIFEYAFTGDYAYMDAYDSTHILAKIEEISNKFRSYFPSLKDAGDLVWERAYGSYIDIPEE